MEGQEIYEHKDRESRRDCMSLLRACVCSDIVYKNNISAELWCNRWYYTNATTGQRQVKQRKGYCTVTCGMGFCTGVCRGGHSDKTYDAKAGDRGKLSVTPALSYLALAIQDIWEAVRFAAVTMKRSKSIESTRGSYPLTLQTQRAWWIDTTTTKMMC